MSATKIWHDKNHRVEYEGKHWIVDASMWRTSDSSMQLRVYRVLGDITDPDLKEALELEGEALATRLDKH